MREETMHAAGKATADTATHHSVWRLEQPWPANVRPTSKLAAASCLANKAALTVP